MSDRVTSKFEYGSACSDPDLIQRYGSVLIWIGGSDRSVGSRCGGFTSRPTAYVSSWGGSCHMIGPTCRCLSKGEKTFRLRCFAKPGMFIQLDLG